MLEEHTEDVVLVERPERVRVRELACEREEHGRVNEGYRIVPDDKVLRDGAPRLQEVEELAVAGIGDRRSLV